MAFSLWLATPAKSEQIVVEHLQQFGTSSFDGATDIAIAPTGRLFVGGNTRGELGDTHFGSSDGFVTGISADGSTIDWTRQFGTTADDFVTSIATDATGNVYVSGSTLGLLGAERSGEVRDSYVAKLNSDGDIQWIDQFGAEFAARSWDIATDSTGNVYSTGEFSDGTDIDYFVAKHDPDGNRLWSNQIGTAAFDHGRAIVVDEDEIYVTGYTSGQLGDESFGRSDVFVAKFDSDGGEMWTHQIGTSADDFGFGIAVSEDDVVVAGSTDGAMGVDAFVTKLNSNGTSEWSRQFGTAAIDGFRGAYITDGDQIVVVGRTDGSLFAESSGLADIQIAYLDMVGNVLASTQFGTALNETSGWHSDVHPITGDLYIAGRTDGALLTHHGDSDAYVTRVSIVPEPNSVVLALIAGIVFLTVFKQGR